MTISPSLVLGRSFLPSSSIHTKAFVTRTVLQIRNNPDVAADITLAAASEMVDKIPSKDLGLALSRLIEESCKARDHSTRP